VKNNVVPYIEALPKMLFQKFPYGKKKLDGCAAGKISHADFAAADFAYVMIKARRLHKLHYFA
jgi:hypothetical protein